MVQISSLTTGCSTPRRDYCRIGITRNPFIRALGEPALLILGGLWSYGGDECCIDLLLVAAACDDQGVENFSSG